MILQPISIVGDNNIYADISFIGISSVINSGDIFTWTIKELYVEGIPESEKSDILPGWSENVTSIELVFEKDPANLNFSDKSIQTDETREFFKFYNFENESTGNIVKKEATIDQFETYFLANPKELPGPNPSDAGSGGGNRIGLLAPIRIQERSEERDNNFFTRYRYRNEPPFDLSLMYTYNRTDNSYCESRQRGLETWTESINSSSSYSLNQCFNIFYGLLISKSIYQYSIEKSFELNTTIKNEYYLELELDTNLKSDSSLNVRMDPEELNDRLFGILYSITLFAIIIAPILLIVSIWKRTGKKEEKQ